MEGPWLEDEEIIVPVYPIQKVQQDIGHGNIGAANGNLLIQMANELIVKIQG